MHQVHAAGLLTSPHFTSTSLLPQIHISSPHLTAHPPQVHISYLELYNEVGYDLLDPGREEAQGLDKLPQVGRMACVWEERGRGRQQGCGC